MHPLKSIKEVQQLSRRVVALNRFVSRLAKHYLPFFKTLKQPKDFQWTKECQKAFEELKDYIGSAPLLSKSESGEELYLCLVVSLLAISAILVQEEGKIQKLIYYISKTLQDAEMRYARLEKSSLLSWSPPESLGHTFKHIVVLLIDQPIKALHWLDTFGRIAKWVFELSEFDLKFCPQPSIKAPMLADFILEYTILDEALAKAESILERTWS